MGLDSERYLRFINEAVVNGVALFERPYKIYFHFVCMLVVVGIFFVGILLVCNFKLVMVIGSRPL